MPINKKNNQEIGFEQAFKYPFIRPLRLFNVLWIFLPVFGWFALAGYNIRIVQRFSQGRFDRLPQLKFFSDMAFGFIMFFKAIPLMIVFGLLVFCMNLIHPWAQVAFEFLVGIFVIPMLLINFYNKKTVGSLFDFSVLKPVFANIADYAVAMIKSALLGIVFLLMWIVLVGIPAGMFTKNIFLADFYRRQVK